ncbi:hypothetical protein V8E55_005045 [Tylopilus felleus]
MDLEFQTISALQTTPFWRSREPGHHDVVFSHIQFLLQALCPQVNAALLAFTLGGTQHHSPGQVESVSSSESLAAIDTGTTLIAAPSDITKEFWSNIPGSVALTGDHDGTRPSEDEMCAGGLFDIGRPEGNDAPSWIVGDVFLTNVYAVFRANPPVVGFAQLTSELSRPSCTSSGTTHSSGRSDWPSGLPFGGATPSMTVSTPIILDTALPSGLFITA